MFNKSDHHFRFFRITSRKYEVNSLNVLTVVFSKFQNLNFQALNKTHTYCFTCLHRTENVHLSVLKKLKRLVSYYRGPSLITNIPFIITL
ncbi:hypothetical protein CHISP_3620 [Chitinispirillum alkaliphilum]|nr:hypothetical protein CHISP_3620 [Chitinispirillum alkaliphilum]